jgi:PAS domain S-box-containing protein
MIMYQTTIENLGVILDTLAEGVLIVKPDYTVAYMNHAMVEVFGEGVGHKCHQVVNRSEKRCPWCMFEEVVSGQHHRRELYLPIADKTYIVKELPLASGAGVVCKLAVYRELSLKREPAKTLEVETTQYKRVFDHAGCGMFISNRAGKFLDVNKAMVKMLGYDSKEELLKIDLARDLYARAEDRKIFMETIERNGRVVGYDVDFRRKDGSTISMLLTCHVRYDKKGNVIGYEGINVDQTQTKQMYRDFEEEHDFLDNVISSSPNPIIAADLRGNIFIWNHAAEETLGYKAEEVISIKKITDIYRNGMAQKVMKMLRSPQYGGKGILRGYPMFFLRKDAERVDGHLSAAIIYDARREEVATVGIFVNTAEIIAMECKLRETQEQLLQSEKLAAMGRLTSQIAHELNNPLYGIMNTLELLKTEISPANKRRKILDMALSETVRLTDMLRKMLSFSKPENEKKKPVDINTILEDLLLFHEKQLMEHSIMVSSDFEKNLGRVNASVNQLRQVFLNIISNAKYAMSEGGTLRFQTKSGDENTVQIVISDTGIGIREEHLDKIFDTFFTTKKDSVKGVGLGLSVCYGFIKEHGGDIKVESTWGSGTTFTIILPVIHHFQANPR